MYGRNPVLPSRHHVWEGEGTSQHTHTQRGLATCTSTVVLVAMTATQDRQEANKLQGGRGSTLSLPTEGEGRGWGLMGTLYQ